MEMRKKTIPLLLWMALTAILFAGQADTASAQNPCNPCGAKATNPCNPCGAKAANPCNPCGDAKAQALPDVPVNPCHAKDGTVFHVGDPSRRDTVTFTSRAPLEDIIGTTNQISGYLVFDPNNPEKGGHGKLVVPVASLDSGIPLRDEHLRSEGWFNAEEYPHITFAIEEVEQIEELQKTDSFATYDVTISGPLTMHGQTKNITVPGRITYLKESPQTQQKMPGDLLAARSTFNVKMSDFGIEPPPGMDVMGTKVSDTIKVEVSVMSSSKDLAGGANPCNPCGGKNPCNPCGAKNPCNPCGAKNPCNPCSK